VLAPEAFVLRFFAERGKESHGAARHRDLEERLLVVNMGSDLNLNPAPEPLLAPPGGCTWKPVFSTEDPRYGGGGTPSLENEENWWIPGHAAAVLVPEVNARERGDDGEAGS
jgi:maltooligosyltrehalose trehalohydrolase